MTHDAAATADADAADVADFQLRWRYIEKGPWWLQSGRLKLKSLCARSACNGVTTLRHGLLRRLREHGSRARRFPGQRHEACRYLPFEQL